MLSRESKDFIKEFYNDERYETFIEELKSEDDILGTKFENAMEKVNGFCEGNTTEEIDEEGVEEDSDKEKMKNNEMKGKEGLAIYIGKIAKKKGY